MHHLGDPNKLFSADALTTVNSGLLGKVCGNCKPGIFSSIMKVAKKK